MIKKTNHSKVPLRFIKITIDYKEHIIRGAIQKFGDKLNIFFIYGLWAHASLNDEKVK